MREKKNTLSYQLEDTTTDSFITYPITMERTFESWFSSFKRSIAPYEYYIDFNTVYKNAKKYEEELNLMNVLIWKEDIKRRFTELVKKYPNVLKCIPTLLAVREYEILVFDETKTQYAYNFKNMNYSIDQYIVFMERTWLLWLLQKHLINNCYDYVLWVECWLNSNARKNRWWHLMEDLVEEYIVKAWFERDKNYFKELKASEIVKRFWINLWNMTNKGKTEKRFDFVIKTSNCVYWIETNCYPSSGSKLNETARSYKMLAEESMNIPWFKFVWFTDWEWRKSAKNNLRETFEVLPTMYNINDMENWMMKEIFK